MSIFLAFSLKYVLADEENASPPNDMVAAGAAAAAMTSFNARCIVVPTNYTSSNSNGITRI